MLRHGSIVNNARLWADRVEIPDGAGWLLPMPLFHTGGCVLGVLGALDRRATLVLMPMFEPGLFLELIELERLWFADTVPTMLIAAMDHPDASRRDLSSWRSTVSGGAQVPEALVRRIEEALGIDFTIVYGQTECSPLLTSTFPSDSAEDKGLTVGPPLPHTEVRIVDPVSLETVPIGTPGELWARGYFTMLGYFDMPEKSAETLRADGWLRTGDLATMDERGYCRIVGRLKDMIIRGGENLFPAEIEEVLYRHPAVAEVAVVGLPDERWGEVVGAFIRPRDPDAPPTVAELRRPRAGPPVTAEDTDEVVRRRRLPAHRTRQDPEVRHPRGVGTGRARRPRTRRVAVIRVFRGKRADSNTFVPQDDSAYESHFRISAAFRRALAPAEPGFGSVSVGSPRASAIHWTHQAPADMCYRGLERLIETEPQRLTRRQLFPAHVVFSRPVFDGWWGSRVRVGGHRASAAGWRANGGKSLALTVDCSSR